MTREQAIENLKELLAWYLDEEEGYSETFYKKEAIDIAIEALEQEQYYKDLANSYEKTINKLTKAISEQEPKTEWIPISEGLPVEEGYYLTTTMYHEVFCDYWNNERFERTETIVAWCELPKPYSEVNNEQI